MEPRQRSPRADIRRFAGRRQRWKRPPGRAPRRVPGARVRGATHPV